MLSTRLSQLLPGALLLTVMAVIAWPFTVDDAFIVSRYATRIGSGVGYSFSDGSATDGVTGPLWLLPLVLGAALGIDATWLAKSLSAGAGLVAGVLVMARVSGAHRGRTSRWVAIVVLSSSLPFVVWSVAGLETGLAALCATGLALAVSRRGRSAGWLAGLCVAALAWLRPELLLFATCLLAARTLRDDDRSMRTAWSLALLGLVSVLLFRQWMFGHWLPMSASAKPALLGNGASYLAAALLQTRALILASLLAYAFIHGGLHVRMWIVALVAHALAVLLVGGDWMPGRRLFAPVVPVLALALALGLRACWLCRPRLLSAALLLLVSVSLLELVPELAAVRAAGFTRLERAPALARLVCSARSPVAIVDLGVVGMMCPRQRFLDLGGLTEPEIAYARGAHLDKHIDMTWLQRQGPGMVVLHSSEAPRVDAQGRLRWFAGYPVENRVLAAPFMRDYRVQHVLPYAPHYYYVLLTRAADRGESTSSHDPAAP